MTAILGISAFYHDSAAALVVDGQIMAAAQEERFSRVKHDPAFPAQAIEYCLQQGNIALQELDAIVFYDKPLLKFERLLETYLACAPKGFGSFVRAMPIWLKEKLYFKSLLRRELRTLIHQQRMAQNGTNLATEKKRDKSPSLPKLLFTEHHQSHAASAFFPSPFEQALVLCLDGVGEWATSSIWQGQGAELKPLYEQHFPHSLGLLYSAFTYYCGFRVNSGEYKLMGLAPYGEARYVDKIRALLDIKDDGSFRLNMDYFDYAAGHTMTSPAFHRLFEGPPRKPHEPMTQKAMDLAASIQVVTEEILLRMAAFAKQHTGLTRLCLAGGVALNCVANGRLWREGGFEQIWVQPAAGDAGGALGAALQAGYQYFDWPRTLQQPDAMQGSFLGPEYEDAQILELLQQRGLTFAQYSDDELFEHIAGLLDGEAVVGWFQGRMEYGPRALGNRSILADPRSLNMQKTLNLKIKFRESFRPFAPAVLAEEAERYFALGCDSPYMLLVETLREQWHLQQRDPAARGLDKLQQARSTFPAITHVDYSARVQTVDAHTNPGFHQLLSAFKKRTGHGMLINTSFNVRGEPPVCSPTDALRCFLATDMDYLVMGHFVLNKQRMPAEQIAEARQVSFADD